jgi:hypothetical protein
MTNTALSAAEQRMQQDWEERMQHAVRRAEAMASRRRAEDGSYFGERTWDGFRPWE